MKLIKNNKVTIFVIILFLVMVLGVIEIKNYLMPDDAKAVYGDRLDGIEEPPLSDSTLKGIEDKLKENDKVTDAKGWIKGKIIKYIITYSDNTSVADAKKVANGLVDMFENDELGYYDLEVTLKKDNKELNNFPIAGYKSPETKTIVYSKDREITKEEENEE